VAFATPKTFVEGTSAKASDVNENFDALEQVVNELLNAVMPVGTVIATARPSAPTGYLLCEGQSVSRTKYSTLFGAIGTTYGKGDGSTTFNVPDLRGRVPVGVDAGANRLTSGGGGSGPNALGNAGGDQHMPFHTHDAGSMGTTPNGNFHRHSIPGFANTRKEGNLNSYTNWDGDSVGNKTDIEDATHIHGVTGRTAGEGSGSSGNMPPYQVVNYAIKV